MASAIFAPSNSTFFPSLFTTIFLATFSGTSINIISPPYFFAMLIIYFMELLVNKFDKSI